MTFDCASRTACVWWHDIWLRELDCSCLVTWHLTARVGLRVSCDMTFDCARWTARVLWHDIWLRELDCAVNCHVTRHALAQSNVMSQDTQLDPRESNIVFIQSLCMSLYKDCYSRNVLIHVKQKETYKRDLYSAKRHIFLSILLIVATPYSRNVLIHVWSKKTTYRRGCGFVSYVWMHEVGCRVAIQWVVFCEKKI